MQLLRGRTSAIGALAFSPDGRYLVAAGDTLHAWDLCVPHATPRTPRLPARGPDVRLVNAPRFVSATALVWSDWTSRPYWWRADLADGSVVELRPPRLTVPDGVVLNPIRATLTCYHRVAGPRPTNGYEATAHPITAGGLADPVAAGRVTTYRPPLAVSPDGSRYVAEFHAGVERRCGLYDAASDERAGTLGSPGKQVYVLLWRFAADGGRVWSSPRIVDSV